MSTDSTTSKFNIQYCKQKTCILSQFSKDLGKEIKNDIEYKPFSLKNVQNYNPIYDKFFEMNENNYNNIGLNHKYKCVGVDEICQQNNNNNIKTQPIFIKYAPLLDPLRYLVGNYSETDEQLTCLPSLNNNNTCNKLLTCNNASYVDNFFCYLSSQLLNQHDLHNGIDYYGSALAIQEKYKFNAVDDLDYLMQSTHFKSNRGTLYDIESNIEDPFSNFGSRRNKNPLVLEDENIELDFDVLENVDEDIEYKNLAENDLELIEDFGEPNQSSETVLKELDSDTDSEIDNESCNNEFEEDGSDVDNEHGGEEEEKDDEEDEDCSDVDNEEDEEDDDDSSEQDSEEEDEKLIYINNFPVQVIMLEKCKGTLDELFVKGEIQDENIANAILMQIIMTLLAYQKAYHFTHNDLHTNNIMWNETDEPYIYYKFSGKIYRVPTFGKIFKIIDFGRSIYKFGGKTFCSDSFAPEGDASSQYNCEPYFNEKKARLEPNFSFDLCRLGTSLYDFIFDEDGEPDKKKMDSFQRTVYRWCTDDNGCNVLYKKNGEERYPGFKLYKMISRLVHKHTPESQLELKPFSEYVWNKKSNKEYIIDIDSIADYTK